MTYNNLTTNYFRLTFSSSISKKKSFSSTGDPMRLNFAVQILWETGSIHLILSLIAK